MKTRAISVYHDAAKKMPKQGATATQASQMTSVAKETP